METKYRIISYRGGKIKGLWSWKVRQAGLTKMQAIEGLHRMKAFAVTGEHWAIVKEDVPLKKMFENM